MEHATAVETLNLRCMVGTKDIFTCRVEHRKLKET